MKKYTILGVLKDTMPEPKLIDGFWITLADYSRDWFTVYGVICYLKNNNLLKEECFDFDPPIPKEEWI